MAYPRTDAGGEGERRARPADHFGRVASIVTRDYARFLTRTAVAAYTQLVGKAKWEADVPMGGRELSELVGCSRPTAVAALQELRRIGLVDQKRKAWQGRPAIYRLVPAEELASPDRQQMLEAHKLGLRQVATQPEPMPLYDGALGEEKAQVSLHLGDKPALQLAVKPADTPCRPALHLGVKLADTSTVEREIKDSSRLGDTLRPSDPLFDAVAAATGTDPSLRSAASFIGKVCSDLRAADPPYSPEDVAQWAKLVQSLRWWKGGCPSLVFLAKDIGRIRQPNQLRENGGTGDDQWRREATRYRHRESGG